MSQELIWNEYQWLSLTMSPLSDCLQSIDSREFILAHELLTLAIEQVKTRGNMRDLARLRLSLANNFVGKNEIERALPLLSLARQDAAKVKDWLYLAYIFALAGHVNQRLNRYAATRY